MIPVEKFIEIWQTSETLSDVVEKTGQQKKAILTQRAACLRRRGVPLKKLRSCGRRVLDIEKLKDLAESLVNGQQP